MDSEELIKEQKAQRLRKLQLAANKGEMLSDSRRKKYIKLHTASDPRNALEALFLQKYGSATPVPHQTMHRKQPIITACMFYIHYGKTIEEACRLASTDPFYIGKVMREDKWDEFAQELVQLNKPSNLTVIPHHDHGVLEAEIQRRRGTVDQLRERERESMLNLKKCEPGSRTSSGILADIKRIRDLIDEAIQLDSYHREMSAARNILTSSVAKKLINTDKAEPRAAKGQIVEL